MIEGRDTAYLPGEIACGEMTLRAWSIEDAQGMVDAQRLSHEELRVWMPWAVKLPTLDEMVGTLQRGASFFVQNRDWAYTILDAEGAVVGSAGLHPRSTPDVLEIGYWVRSDRTGKGVATKVATALTDAAFECALRIDRVEICTHARNLKSQAVARKLGFVLVREQWCERQGDVPEGTVLYWSIDRAAWLADASSASSHCAN